MSATPDTLTMLQDCQDLLRCVKDAASEWERNFLHSVRKQFDATGTLSAKQVLILKTIWEKIT